MSRLLSYSLKTVILFLAIVVFESCQSAFISNTTFSSDIPVSPNYDKEESWAVLPSKYSDALKAFAPNDINKLEADVFYVYPTLMTDNKDLRWNVPVNDKEQNDKVLHKTVLFQASAWLKAGKLYVPYYRQAHLRSYSKMENGGKEALLLAYRDVKSAFKTYLKKYNQGRPIIIVGHSQGTTHCIMLLKDFFDDKPLQNKLIAAYIPGIGVDKNEFKTIKSMVKPDQTGGFISWNTYRKNKFPKKYDLWYKNKVTTNPISWDNSKSTSRKDHKGFLFSNGKIYNEALKIDIINGLVWTSLPRFPYRLFLIFKKNYHIGDINLFWKDIQNNAQLRVRSWIEKQ
jgi:hypothetical protein